MKYYRVKGVELSELQGRGKNYNKDKIAVIEIIKILKNKLAYPYSEIWKDKEDKILLCVFASRIWLNFSSLIRLSVSSESKSLPASLFYFIIYCSFMQNGFYLIFDINTGWWHWTFASLQRPLLSLCNQFIVETVGATSSPENWLPCIPQKLDPAAALLKCIKGLCFSV